MSELFYSVKHFFRHNPSDGCRRTHCATKGVILPAIAHFYPELF
ncbi:hypothetical protein Y026_4116 [Burkholderia pseudomallei TSV28]|uniref:Uncharacterized protein n=1 Tax=Burkholderia pseudomallei 1710a TaxID=320371 RepID=A0A0E1W9R7_BURPE|nr:hypothetical protein BURPS1710A_3206 [Burkholderia pseudomallei 1710a]KGX69812.1 hypothetical protein Y026_4116 [Burkholderia pseudomallei TSV28]